jgi:hypothetical protein
MRASLSLQYRASGPRGEGAKIWRGWLRGWSWIGWLCGRRLEFFARSRDHARKKKARRYHAVASNPTNGAAVAGTNASAGGLSTVFVELWDKSARKKRAAEIGDFDHSGMDKPRTE